MERGSSPTQAQAPLGVADSCGMCLHFQSCKRKWGLTLLPWGVLWLSDLPVKKLLCRLWESVHKDHQPPAMPGKPSTDPSLPFPGGSGGGGGRCQGRHRCSGDWLSLGSESFSLGPRVPGVYPEIKLIPLILLNYEDSCLSPLPSSPVAEVRGGGSCLGCSLHHPPLPESQELVCVAAPFARNLPPEPKC